MNTKSIALATSFLTTTALAAPFTYQGTLQDAGSPANGQYDLRISLHDALVGGSQIGPTIDFDDVNVTDGLFELDIDFGDVYDATQTYLFIQVRDGASIGTYTGLAPRSTITATPKAQYAATAGALENPQWIDGLERIHYGDGDDRVFINRSNPIDPTEVFGVHSNTPDYVGMFMSGPLDSIPYYAYSVNGFVNAYTYFSPFTSRWTLWFAGADALWVDAERNLTVANDVIASNYNYASPKTNYASIMGDSFHSASGDPFIGSSGNGGTYINNPGSGWLVSPIQLPHGAEVTSVRAYFTDNNTTGDLFITLSRRTHGSNGFVNMAIIDTAGFNGSLLEATDDTIGQSTIDNNLHCYQLRVWSDGWDGSANMQIESMVVEYTTTHAD